MDFEDWPTEGETAARLGVTIRSVNRYVERGSIEMRKRQRAGKKAENVCNPRDVEKLMPAAHVMPEDPAPDIAGIAVQRTVDPRFVEKYNGPLDPANEFIAFLRAVTASMKAEPNVSAAAAWMSVEDAAEYLCLSEDFIRRQIREKKIVGLRGGPHGSMRVLRKSLDAFFG